MRQLLPLLVQLKSAKIALKWLQSSIAPSSPFDLVSDVIVTVIHEGGWKALPAGLVEKLIQKIAKTQSFDCACFAINRFVNDARLRSTREKTLLAQSLWKMMLELFSEPTHQMSFNWLLEFCWSEKDTKTFDHIVDLMLKKITREHAAFVCKLLAKRLVAVLEKIPECATRPNVQKLKNLFQKIVDEHWQVLTERLATQASSHAILRTLPPCCEACTNIEAFLRHPKRTELRLQENKSTRRHLYNVLKKIPDVSAETATEGKSQLLVITKNRVGVKSLEEELATVTAMKDALSNTTKRSATTTKQTTAKRRKKT
jgi:hypothetical protein